MLAVSHESIAKARLLLRAAKLSARWLGGPGSGNFGHAGRPGEVGGSSEHPTTVYGAGKSVTLPGRYDKTKLPKDSLAVVSQNGYILVTKASNAPDYMWVNHIRVADKAQGKGEGSALYKAALDAAQARGFKGILKGEIVGRGVSTAAQRVWASFERKGLTEPIQVTTPNGTIDTLVLVRKESLKTAGGAGSGNFGHAGRKGEVGGSGPGDPLAGEPHGKHTPEGMQKLIAYLEKEIGGKYKPHGSVKHGGTSENDFDIIVVPDTWEEIERQSDEANRIQSEIQDKYARGEISEDEMMQELFGDGPDIVTQAMSKIGFELEEAIEFDSSPTGRMGDAEIAVSRFKREKTGHRIELWSSLYSGEPRDLGGKGSGNFGHSGRPGQVGGSSDDGPVNFEEDARIKYPNAPDLSRIEIDVEGIGEALEADGKLDDEGFLSLYHVTGSDPDDILKEGLIPGKVAAPGQDWAAEHGSYATYFFRDREHALDQAAQAGEGFSVIRAQIAITDAMLRRLVPDEDTGLLAHEGIEALLNGENVGVIGGVPRSALTKIDQRSLDNARALGNANSGNHGHAGRPGQVGGSASAGFVPATAARRKELGLPPAWTDVRVNPDPEGALQAVGTDVKGRTQYRYSAEHSAAAAAEKFARMKAFEKQLPKLRERVDKDRINGSEEAAVVNLIDKTGFRVGGSEDTLADKQAYGASSLLVEHVKVNGDDVTFSFVGKKGVDIDKTVTDKDLAKDLRARTTGKKRSDKVFDTDDGKVRAYMGKVAPEFSPKDFRTRHATAMALELVRKIETPSTAKELKLARKQVGEKVAEFLGNTHTVALKSYINPAVFAKWEAR